MNPIKKKLIIIDYLFGRMHDAVDEDPTFSNGIPEDLPLKEGQSIDENLVRNIERLKGNLRLSLQTLNQLNDLKNEIWNLTDEIGEDVEKFEDIESEKSYLKSLTTLELEELHIKQLEDHETNCTHSYKGKDCFILKAPLCRQAASIELIGREIKYRKGIK